MAVLTLALAGCGTLGTPDSATEQGNEVTSLWRPFVIIAIGIGAADLGPGRLVRGPLSPAGRRHPDQRQSHVPLEVVYTGIPIGIVAVFFAFTLVAQERIVNVDDHPDLVVDGDWVRVVVALRAIPTTT